MIYVALFEPVSPIGAGSFKRNAEDAFVRNGDTASIYVPADSRTLSACAPLPVVIYFAVATFFILIDIFCWSLSCKLPDYVFLLIIAFVI